VSVESARRGAAGPDGEYPLVLAMYLPQFHRIPENDAWYGDGFTEWTFVAGARPLYPGHRQPDLPGELGFYDLRVPQARYDQAHLARQHGISGFVYLHYWFHGHEIFQEPLDEVLTSGSPSLPFAVCWANENWDRLRYAATGDVLLEQSYDTDDDLAHITRLIELFKDPRYIRVRGRPLLIVSSAHLLPDPIRTVEVWRAACSRAGMEPPWLVMGERPERAVDPAQLGFDASVDMLPPFTPGRTAAHGTPTAIPYREVVTSALGGDTASWTRYPSVAPAWDDTPRRQDGGALIWQDSTPDRYGQWLAAALDRQKVAEGGNGIVFINAWNDWANGAHLEPDAHWGRVYLETTKRVVEDATGTKPAQADTTDAEVPATVDDLYAELYTRHRDLQASASGFLSYADRRLSAAQDRFTAELAESREESRRLAAALAPLENLVAMQTARANDLEALLVRRPPRPAVVRTHGDGDLAEPGESMLPTGAQGRARYFELLKACLTRMLFLNDQPGRDPLELAKLRDVRMIGKDWPEDAETMVGMLRLDCIQECVETVIREGVPGDLLEAGVWRGGATILMKGILAAYGVQDRRVWVADSFRGLPVPDEVNFPQDVPEDLSSFDELAVSQEQVRANFARYDLLDDNVRFLEGWFKDTLSTAPVDALAVLRLDGDYYESTIQILESLYHKVSPGGFVIVDDYGCIEACRQAVTDFRVANGIEDPIVKVDWTGVYWRRSGT
jgi:hypothetical protein